MTKLLKSKTYTAAGVIYNLFIVGEMYQIWCYRTRTFEEHLIYSDDSGKNALNHFEAL